MNKFTNKQIEDTLNMINSSIINCEKIQPKLKEGSPQLSLNKNRIKALYISKALITNQIHDYKKEELLKSVAQITSIINKSKSGISHAKEGSGTYTRFRKIIDSMTIALLYIEEAIKES
jgi:penicillin V acylase-like amidase (Ntn superfamily)